MLELKNICYSVVDDDGNVKKILDDVSLKLTEGFTVITGPNGSGKSTIAKIIMGILKPDSGKIFLDGEDITDMSVTERARLGVSFAFQQPVRFKGIKVKDLINFAAGKEISISDACRYLSEVGLCARDYIDREVNSSLSGGELKRIEIATLLARSTKLSLFDEPEAGIDIWSFNSLIKVFEKLHDDINGTIVIISHQERILNVADRIVLLSGGKVEKDGTRDEIFDGLFCKEGVCRVLSDKM